MLVKVHNEDSAKPRSKAHFNISSKLENMTITYYPELALFLQSIDENKGLLTITHGNLDSASKSVDIPLEPDCRLLEEVDVLLHQSSTKAYKVGNGISEWFSQCLGYNVELVYLGPHRRPVLGNLSPNTTPAKSQSWLSNLSSSLPDIVGAKTKDENGISFADVAAYLVVTEESLQNVSARLTDGLQMDMTKFRPNIVVSGARHAWDEDYWGGLTIHNSTDGEVASQSKIEITLTQNCARCISINVDYSTGQAGQGEEGNVLKKLMKDRRVDQGTKYSPIFGRYGFLDRKGSSTLQRISVGDEVEVSKFNAERTTFGR